MNKETAVVYNDFFIVQMEMKINVGCICDVCCISQLFKEKFWPCVGVTSPRFINFTFGKKVGKSKIALHLK